MSRRSDDRHRRQHPGDFAADDRRQPMMEICNAYAIQGLLTYSGDRARAGFNAFSRHRHRLRPHRARAGSAPRAASERPRDDLAGKLVRRIIQRAPSSIPGREIVQVETEIPAGVESGWHVHPGEEVGYIIAGKVEMKVEGRPTVILRAGDGFLIPPRTPHNARDLGPETGGCSRPISSSKASRSRRSCRAACR